MLTRICNVCRGEKVLGLLVKDKNAKYARRKLCLICSLKYKARHIKTDKGKAAIAKYKSSAKAKVMQAGAMVKYRASDKGKEAQAKYNVSDEGKAAFSKYTASDKGKIRQAQYRASEKGKVARIRGDAKYYATDKGKAARFKYRATDKRKALIAEYASKYKKNNKGIVNAITSAYNASKLQRTPIWSNAEDIKVIYIKACKEGMSVDHKLPLQGKKISGLHVLSNLQLLTKSENSSKRNKLLLKEQLEAEAEIMQTCHGIINTLNINKN